MRVPIKEIQYILQTNVSTTIQWSSSVKIDKKKGPQGGCQDIAITIKKGVVYSISCKDCDNVYVGQTGRTTKEHCVYLMSTLQQLQTIASRKTIVPVVGSN